MIKIMVILLVSLPLMISGCTGEKAGPQMEELRRYALDDLSGLITRDNIEFDGTASVDGFGAIKIEAAESTTVRLFETGDIEAEDAKLLYRAKIKTDNFKGRVFLEIWCVFEDMGEFFGRDMQTPIMGTVDWSSEEVLFLLQKDQDPVNVKLNLVVDGAGTVWVDDISLIKVSLQ